MTGRVVGLLVLAAAAQGCGSSSSPPNCPMPAVPFSPAAITVDSSKQMADLTTDERASVCAEFTRSITDSFGSLEVECKFGSHSGTRTNDPAACEAWYQQCLQMPQPDPLMYCTDKMSGMWSCPVTIGQYTACFNDLESALLTSVEIAAPCGGIANPLCAPVSPPSCAVAACDYTWFD
jgi:hypothetical protein